MENNRQFELMRSAARQKLEGADPVQLSVLTGLCWDGTTFDAETLDSVYMRSSQNSQPNSDTPDMNSRKER